MTMQRPQQPPQLEKIEEQEIVLHAPEIQEMATGAAGRSPVNAARFARRTETAPHRRSVRQPLVENRQLDRSSQVQALQSSLSGPESFNQSVSQTQKRRCSPCSESIIRCCQTSFKPLTDRFRDHARTLSQSGPSSLVPAQRLVSLRNAPSNELSTESSRFEWDDRLTDELVQEYFSQPTEEDKEEFFDTCVSNVSESKANRFYQVIYDQEKDQQKRDRDKVIVRASEISPHLHYSRLFEDTAPEGGFSEGSSRQFRQGNYEENVLWQLRLVPNNAAQIKPTDIDSYSTMQSHSGDITNEQITSLRRKLDKCSEKSRGAQKRGRKRLLKVAIENGHIRTLPVIFDGDHDEQNVNNIAVILKHEPDCKFSADKKVALLVEQAYKEVGLSLPNLENTFISSSLPANIYSIGRNNVQKGTINPPDTNWISRTARGRKKTCPLKTIERSLKFEEGKVTDMILVNQDHCHLDKHWETYDSQGNYLGKMDKDTMLLYAEALPDEDRVAVREKDVK